MLKKPEGGYLLCYQFLDPNGSVVQSCRPYKDWCEHACYEELQKAPQVLSLSLSLSFSNSLLIS